MTDDSNPLPRIRQGNRRGPDKRQRPLVAAARVSSDELTRLRAKADAAGVSVGDLIRHAALDASLPVRRQRRSRTDLQPVAALLQQAGDLAAELGKQGSNLNQLAHQANGDRIPAGFQYELRQALAANEDALRTLLEIRTACMEALGFERGDEQEDA